MVVRAESHWGRAIDVASLLLLGVVVLLLLRNASKVAPPEQRAELSRALADSTWEKLWSDAHVRGAAGAKMRLLLFSDVECPFCRRFTDSLQRWDGYRDTALALGLLHFPLSQHRYALPGANTIECSAEVSEPWAVYEALVLRQEDLPSKSYAQLLGEAGVPVGEDFERCMAEERFGARILAQTNLARQLGVTGTPGVVVNGQLFNQPPSVKTLDSLLRSLRK